MDWDSDAIQKVYNLYLKKYDDYETYLISAKKNDIFTYTYWFIMGLLIGVLIGVLL